MEAVRRVSYTERRIKRGLGFDTVQVCRFYPASYSLKPEFTASCPWSEVVLLAERLEGRLQLKRRSLRVSDGAYKRLLVYAAVRTSLRNPSKVRELEEVVRSLEEYELHFWFTRFLAAYERGVLAVRRPVRAFKVLHGLD